MPSAKAPPPIYRLKITLIGIEPPIWRRMLVTSSHFSTRAREFQRRHEYRLALRDFDGIKEWIQRHDFEA